jgi:hypothetical protein
MIFSTNESKWFYEVSWHDLGGWGCYKLVSESMVPTLNLDGPCMSKLKLQSARGALRELLGGNGKLRRSGGAVITTIVVDNHEIEFE